MAFIQLGRVDELGSGVLKVSRLIKEYAKGANAQFIEGAVFKTIIPKDTTINTAVNKLINDGVNGGVNDKDGGINDGVNDISDGIKTEIVQIAELVSEKEGISTSQIAKKLGKSKRTIERYIRTAKNLGIIEYRGSQKTGGYFLTAKMKNIKS